MITRMRLTTRLCKGCGYCLINCPKGAIRLSGPINALGCPTPAVDGGSCVLCGICYTVCPAVVFEFMEEEP